MWKEIKEAWNSMLNKIWNGTKKVVAAATVGSFILGWKALKCMSVFAICLVPMIVMTVGCLGVVVGGFAWLTGAELILGITGKALCLTGFGCNAVAMSVRLVMSNEDFEAKLKA